MNVTYQISFPIVYVFLNGKKIGHIERKAGMTFYTMYFCNGMENMILYKDFDYSKAQLEKNLSLMQQLVNQ